jgi:inner membrane protein
MEGRRRIPWGWTWLFSWMGVLSHLAMDWTNIYGIRLLLPFSSEWLRLDTVNVVDLAIWAILLLGVAAPALGRLVSSEIGARQGTGRGWATAVLLMLALYEGGRVVAHQRAVETLEARIYEGEAPIRVAALAQTPNPFAWKGVVETQASWIVFYMNLLDDFDPAAGQVYYKAAAHPAIEAAKKTREFGALLAFSTFLTWRVTPSGSAEGVWTVELIDLRFGTPSSPGLSAVAEVDTGGTARSAAVGFGRIQPR